MPRLLFDWRNSRLHLPLLLILLASCLSPKAQMDTALLNAIQRCDLPALQRIEKRGADINAVDGNGSNALMWAVYSCDLPLVKELVYHGARVGDSAVIYFSDGNLENGYYGSLQNMAASRGKLAMLQYLADSLHLPLDENEFDPFVRKKEGWTPLSCAAYYGHADIAAYLLQKGVYSSAPDKTRHFPALLLAVKTGHWNVFDLLMKAGFKKELGEQGTYFMGIKARFEKEYLGKINDPKTIMHLLGLLYQGKPDGRETVPLQRHAIELAKAYVGQENPLYASNIAELASYESYLNPFPLYEQALAIQKKTGGEEGIAYATSLCNLAVAYRHKSEYGKALPLLQQALPAQKKAFGEESVSYAACLNNLAALYTRMKQHENAVPLLQQAVTICRKAIGEAHPAYAILLRDLAQSHIARGQYEQALPLLQQVVDIRRNDRDEVYAAIVSKWNSLAGLFYCMRQYRKGNPSKKDSRWKEQIKEVPPDYTASLFELVDLYRTMGRYTETLPLLQEALTATKKIQGEQHLVYIFCLNNLSISYIMMGQYEKAFPLLQQALLITRQVRGENHFEYARVLNYLSDLYTVIGQYEKALPLLQQALAIRKEDRGEDHTEYAANLNSLATVYGNMGQFDKALPLLQQAVSINKKISGEKHPNYARSIIELANVHVAKGQLEMALPLYQQAADITKNFFGEDHTNYATSISNIGQLYVYMGAYDKALPLFEKALANRKKILGEENYQYTRSLTDIAWTYANQGLISKAAPYAATADSLTLTILTHIYTSLSEKEKTDFLKKQFYQFAFLPSLSALQGVPQPSIMKQLYTNELALKGMVLQDQQGVFRSIQQSGNTHLVKLFGQWRANKTLVGKQLLLPANKRLPYFDNLQETTNQLEQELSRQAAGFRDALRGQAMGPGSIAQKLLHGQAAVEFIRFPFYRGKWTDSILYAALVLLPGDSTCRFVPLCEERQLKRLVSRSTAIRTTGISNDSLYTLIWKPLEKYLAGTPTIYYAPAGLLHRIAFQSLRADSTHLLIDKYRLNQLLSTRSVALPADAAAKPATATVWGNIDYGTETGQSVARRGLQDADEQMDALSSFMFYNTDTRGLRNRGWPPLSGTRQEIDSIARMLMQAGIHTTVNSGAMATEEAFKALDGKGPRLLHLATHGFFLPVAENKPTNNANLVSGRESFTIQQNPMFRSGLILAGGNHTWKGEPSSPGREDGILTAYEIAQIDLSNTDLVVLSACETALGDLQGNEGVFGLQRAFKMAGVKQLIVSLWKVPDAETTELMTQFYRNWLGGQSTREALRQAQLKMKEKYPPEKWAAFVLVE